MICETLTLVSVTKTSKFCRYVHSSGQAQFILSHEALAKRQLKKKNTNHVILSKVMGLNIIILPRLITLAKF